MIRRNLIPVLTWLREWRQDRVAASEVIEESTPVLIEQAPADPFDLRELAECNR